MGRRVITVLVPLAAVVVLGIMAPASAHVPDRATAGALPAMLEVDREGAASATLGRVETLGKVVPPPSGGSSMPVLMLAALLILASRSRRTVRGLLVLLLAVSAFETGVHSVHHLGDEDAEARCVVASGSANHTGAVGQPATFVVGAVPSRVAVLVEPLALPGRVIHPDRGRAPPFVA
jgi:hypothetical protein